MVGNPLQGDSSGNILVEFDYNNIIVVDPNKTIDTFGNIRERLVDHEKLVMYANLEAEVLPRTKLAVGASPAASGDSVRIISVAKMNFLKPSKNTYLSSNYYDEITGENTTKFKGENQMDSKLNNPKDGTKSYVTESPANLQDVLDNGLLGITQINIQTNSSFIPTVKIELEDIQGRALFQLGNNSPYAAFFNLPYPPFYLTLKGYYGQAVRYQLNLEKFNARFNSISGNYQVSLEFKGYKFNVLNEIAMGHLLALPHMYSQTFNITSSPKANQPVNNSLQGQTKAQTKVTNATNSNSAVSLQLTSEKGYQKIYEVYSEYKAKGLIAPDFPELTVLQLMNKLQQFEQNIANSFTPVEVEPLTNIRNYKQTLKDYFDTVRGGNFSWFAKYLNPAPLILKNGDRVYVFKNLDLEKQRAALSELSADITNYNNALSTNKTLGSAGTDPIANPIKYKTVAIPTPTFSNIDWKATTTQQTGIPNAPDETVNRIINQYSGLTQIVIQKDADGNIKPEEPKFFQFEGKGRYDDLIASIESQANKKLSAYEAKITAKLLNKLQDSSTGIGFKPTVRNMIAVIMASAEAFIRLLDDVHTNAWNVKYDPVRKNAILNNPSSAPGSDTADNLKIAMNAVEQSTGLKYAEIPVYPWPQFFVETPEDKKGRFQLKYIADPTVVDITQGYLYDKWPEVEFVEEYMKGIVKKFDAPSAPEPLGTEKDTNVININAIEFPSSGIAYLNKEEIKFYYEIWERQFVTSHYSGYIRANSNQINDLVKLNTEAEASNIFEAVNVSAPYITMKLKNYDLKASNYETFLQSISNSGTGRAWQDFIRDFYVTPYIKAMTENPTVILSTDNIGKIPQLATKSDALLKLITNASNEKLITDTIPFSNPNWNVLNLSNGVQSNGTEVYNTNKTLKIFEDRKVIANFNDIYNYSVNRPVTNFSYITNNNPYGDVMDAQVNQEGLKTFYESRILSPEKFVATEGYCDFTSPSNQLPVRTTTSMLNTPYMVNAIQAGVKNAKSGTTYPYVQAAYVFLNSLPLASLREKYKTINDNVTSDLDYIASCFNKFGGVHKLPYAWILKMGSVWHRYRKYKESGVDILSDVWKNFDYLTNYSPIQSALTQTYKFNYNGEETTIILQSSTNEDIVMNVGFYPKLINDFNYFYNGYNLYSGYTDAEISASISDSNFGGMKIFSFQGANINTAQQKNSSAQQNGKNLRMKTWSVILPDHDGSTNSNCNPKNNTVGSEYYIVPSFGSQVNQSYYECFTNLTTTATTVVDVTDNSSVYNGSVRSLWSSPNYGYFDNNEIVMPSPDSYINYIYPSGETQTAFKLLNTQTYSKIEEIFAVFDKATLDQFETEFLNFSKPLKDADTQQAEAQFNTSTVNAFALFRNFQSLYRSLMTINAQPKTQGELEYFQNTITNQYDVFQNQIKGFMEYDVLVRIGNPSKYNRRVLDSYISYLSVQKTVTDPITFKPYFPGSLPTLGGQLTLAQSKANNPKEWYTLETEVGFSTIPGVEYTSQGSYITNFFVENNIEFTSQNIVLLAPIIKMWATSKLETPSLTPSQFKNELSIHLKTETDLQNTFLDNVLTAVRAKLPNQSQLPERTISSAISGEQSKVENWEVFKALNDKWIAGGDYKNKTLFEDMLFLDRASRNIGEVILLDIFDLQNMFTQKSLNQAMSVFTFISGLLIKNNFTVMNLPAYVNFYNVQDVGSTTTPPTEGSLQFADSMWGTFLDVDYRNSAPKMVCFYVGKPSQYLDLPKGNFRFRDDGFDLRRASENPLIENQQGKKDWGLSNKCVGFNVDLGIRNQNIFYSFSVSQDSGVATSESINTQINMVDQATGKNVATQNNSLYNLYKQRSYKATVTCLGNALLQPSMYFNLRHVPMFNGPYMILDVQHSVQPGSFNTTFTGIRQGIYDLPSIDNFLQSINQNLLTRLEEVLKIKSDKPTIPPTTESGKSNSIVQKANNTPDTSNSCLSNVDRNAYPDYLNVPPVLKSVSDGEFTKALQRLLPNKVELQASIYTISYIRTYQKDSGTKGVGAFKGYNNNLGLISLYNNWNPTTTYFTKNFCCINVKTGAGDSSQPLVNFASIDEYIKFMAARIEPNLGKILRDGLVKYYVTSWPKEEGITASYYDAHTDEYATLEATATDALKSALAAGLIPKETLTKYKITIDKVKEDAKKPTVTPTPTKIPVQPGQVCPPPIITTFKPTVGNTGTIIQINGVNMDIVNEVQILGVTIPNSQITFLNNTSIRVSVPNITLTNNQTTKTGKIVLTSNYGNSQSTTDFTYDKSVNPSAVSSPGGYNNTQSPSPTPSATVGTVSPTQAASVSTNPQNTGPNPLVIAQQTKYSLGGDDTLIVKINTDPNVGVWKINSQPVYSYVIKTIQKGPNNQMVEIEEVSQPDESITNTVSADGQTFSINRQTLINNEFLQDIENLSDNDIKIYLQFKLMAIPADREKYPQHVLQNYNFVIFVPGVNTQQTHPGNLLFIQESSNVDLPNYSGPDYYNIKKPAGGYITYQFTCTKLINKGKIEVLSIPDLVTQNITITNTPDTKYTNVIEVNGLGRFQLSQRYQSEDFTYQGQPVNAGATSPPFTL